MYRIEMEGIPPKKYRTNTMWRKGSEFEDRKALPVAASKAVGDGLQAIWGKDKSFIVDRLFALKHPKPQ